MSIIKKINHIVVIQNTINIEITEVALSIQTQQKLRKTFF